MAASDDKASLGDIAAGLARRWATQRLAAVQSYGRILADYGAGRSTTTGAAGALARLAAEEAVRYPSDAVTLAADYATAVAKRAGVSLKAEADSVRRAAPIRDIALSGALGSVASSTVYLSNPHDRAAHLTFSASNFSNPDGETTASLTFAPPDLTLAPGEEKPVQVSATLDAAAFTAGRDYTANVAISGFDDMVLRVRLSILEAG
jgi:hypothetical protein